MKCNIHTPIGHEKLDKLPVGGLGDLVRAIAQIPCPYGTRMSRTAQIVRMIFATQMHLYGRGTNCLFDTRLDVGVRMELPEYYTSVLVDFKNHGQAVL